MLVKCATCQRQYESTKFSVDCPHATALTEWARSTGLPRKEWEHDAAHAASVATELSSLVNIQDGFITEINNTVLPEQITDEMVAEWTTLANDQLRELAEGFDMDGRSVIAHAVNVYLKHCCTAKSIQSGSIGSALTDLSFDALHSISAHVEPALGTLVDQSVSAVSPPSLRSGD